ncbi:MAG: discoidin domain-containing protein [Desulfosporosinus sp.]|nr:discoidin domain-containing protein [Desulfosporosinus sp.]
MKKTLVLTIVASVMWISSAEVCAVNYYVDATDGNDSWNGRYPSYQGASSGPWRTIAKVNAQGFGDDDVVSFKRGGIFNDATLTLDSTPAGRTGITVQDYGTGDKPFFDGNTIQPIVIDHALENLTIKNIDIGGWDYGTRFSDRNRAVFRYVNGITIDGVDFDGHKNGSTLAGIPDNGYLCVGPPYPDAGWVYIVLEIDKNNYGDITIKNCTISNLLKTEGDGGFAGSVAAWCKSDLKAIVIRYDDSVGGKEDGVVYIHDNTITNVYSDSIQINGVQVSQYIYNNTCIGYGENFLDVKGSSFGKVYNNEISCGNIGKDPGGGWFGPNTTTFHDCGVGLPVGDYEIYSNYIYTTYGSGLYVGNGNNFKVYNNYIKDCLVGIRVARGSGIEIYNNVIETTDAVLQDPDDNYDNASYRSGILFMEASILNSKVYNNTVYVDNDNPSYGIAFLDPSGNEPYCKNNIIYTTDGNEPGRNDYPLYWKYYGSLPPDYPPVLGNNSYYNPNTNKRAYWNGEDKTTANITDIDGNAIDDPGLQDIPNSRFALQPTSPATNAGADLGSPYNQGLSPASTWPDNVFTLDQDAYDDWEIGAFVFTDIAQSPMDQTGWELLYVDSEEMGDVDRPATDSFDGDTDTFWCTEWSLTNPDPAHPHEIQIDLGNSYNICEFRQLPRQDGSEHGRIKDYEFYVSGDKGDWGTAVASGTFANDQTEKTVLFDNKLGRYVRLVALSEVNGNPWTTMAELNILAVQLESDINSDGKVNLEDFAVLSAWWDNENACSSPGWCGGADFNMSGTVDMSDLTYFAENWLRQAG